MTPPDENRPMTTGDPCERMVVHEIKQPLVDTRTLDQVKRDLDFSKAQQEFLRGVGQ